jgi:H/ACA ribonucleoprotein complex subunit 4
MRIHEEIELEKIEEMIKKKFMGKIKQTPPLKSRVKRQEREREIKKFDLIEKEGMDILFHTTVEGGTYIRKLCDDLGKELGIGAHMLELRRVRAGVFSEEDEKFVNLYDIEKVSEEELKKLITPAEEALKKIMPSIEIRPDNIQKLYAGNKLLREEVISDMDFREGTLLAVFSKELFIGIYRVIHEGIKFARPEFVFQPVKT